MSVRNYVDFSPKDFRGYASDFDGTISDSLGAHKSTELETYRYMVEKTGDERFLDITDEVMAQAHNLGSNDTAIIGGALVIAGIAKNLHEDIVTKTVNRKRKLYNGLCRAGMNAQPGGILSLQILHEQRPDQTFISTTAHLEEVTPFLRKHSLTSLFPRERLVVNEDVDGRLKPDPYAYQIPLYRVGETDASSFAAYEDTPVGIKAARRAGLVVVALATTHSEDELLAANPDYIFEDHTELQAALAK